MMIGFDWIARLPCWVGTIDIEVLAGGMTNRNYRVRDALGEYAVRWGKDLPEHGVKRINELVVARAAFAAGIAPEVLYGENGVLVTRWVAAKPLSENDLVAPSQLRRVLDLIKGFHQRTVRHLGGPVLMFSVSQVIGQYLTLLQNAPNNPLSGHMTYLLGVAESLELAQQPIEVVVGHNDLMAANILDDGQRLWLIDFEYAGFNSPLFDLANFSYNNQLTRAQDEELLWYYFGEDKAFSQVTFFQNMKRAALLRDLLWCGVSQMTSPLGLDHSGHIQESLQRL